MRPIDRPNNLDTVRLLAALMVIVAHSCVPFDEWKQAHIAGWGRIAVMIFFVLSGYLITASWQSNPCIVDFSINRTLRLLPALAVVVLLAALVLGPLMTTLPTANYLAHEQFWIYFKNLLIYPMSDRLPGVFDQDNMLSRAAINGSLWTLRIEFSMYVLVAILGFTKLLRSSVMIAMIVIFWLLYIKYGYLPITGDTIFFYMEIKEIARFGICFCIGALIRLQDATWSYNTKAALAALAFMLIGTQAPWRFEYFLFIGLPIIILWISFCPWLRLPRLSRYGDFSYGVYIYAFPIQQLYLAFFGLQYGIMPFMLFTTILSLACGALSWHLVEKPTLKLKRNTMRVRKL